MMNKSTKLERFLDFLAGRGFYIILGLCVVAIGVSGYMLLFGGDSGEENPIVMQHSPMPSVYSVPSPTPRVTNPPVAVNPPTEMVPVIQPNPSVPSMPSVQSETKAPAPTHSPTEMTRGEKATAEQESPDSAEVLAPDAMVFSRPVAGEIIQPHSMTELVRHETLNVWRVHPGIDIAVAEGTIICAASDGTVVDIYEDPTYGISVKIDHGDGLASVYSNLDPEVKATMNHLIKMGEAIGKVGQSAEGESGDETHLHFAMLLNDEQVDPMEYLPK